MSKRQGFTIALNAVLGGPFYAAWINTPGNPIELTTVVF